MKKNKGILAILLSSFTLIGCGNESEVTTTVDNKNAIEISISWWGSDTRNEYTLAALQEFEKIHPEIIVKPSYSAFEGYEANFKSSVISNSTTDIVNVNYNWLYEYTPDGNFFLDLSEMKEELKLDSFSDFDLSLCTLNNKLVGLPVATNFEAIYYNKSLFDKYNLDIPETYEDLYNAAKVMSKDGIYPLGMVKKWFYMLACDYVQQKNGKEIMSLTGDLIFDENDFADMIILYKELLDNNVIPNVENYDKQLITDEKVAGLVAWITDGGSWSEVRNNNHEVVVGRYPKITNNSHPIIYSKPSSLFCISGNCKHPKEAALLLDFILNSKEMMEKQGTEKGIPSSSIAVNYLADLNAFNNSLEFQAYTDAKDNAEIKPMGYYMENSANIDAFLNAANEYVYGVSTIEKASLKAYESFKNNLSRR